MPFTQIPASPENPDSAVAAASTNEPQGTIVHKTTNSGQL
jgi:hypothetical protein